MNSSEKDRAVTLDRRFMAGLAGAVALWATLYTAAYFRQEARVEAMQITVDAFDFRLRMVSADQRMLLTYVITFRERMIQQGFDVPPMPPMPSEEGVIEAEAAPE